jgi:hypothetical protein
LWDGIDSSTGDLSISIENPYYSSSDSDSSRALALQGEYLYIELARIDDIDAYNADVDKAVTGDGVWTETDWGARAILTFSLSSTSTLIATFKDVPRDEDIMARVIQDTDADTVAYGLYSDEYESWGYEDGSAYPICTTYDAAADDIFYPTIEAVGILDQCWVTITSSELSSGAINLPLRPYDYDYSPSFTGLDFQISESYIDSSTAIADSNTEPSPGNTRFSDFNLDLSSDKLNNPAVYISADTDLSFSPGVVALYDEDGSALAIQSGSSSDSFKVVILDIESSYTKSMFIGSTVYDFGVELTEEESLYSGKYYNVGYGMLYSSSGLAADGTVSWFLPTGFDEGDLEFSIIHIAESGISTADILSISDIYNSGYTLDFDTNWDQTDISSNSYSNVLINNAVTALVIVLARVPGGSSFIFAKYSVGS